LKFMKKFCIVLGDIIKQFYIKFKNKKDNGKIIILSTISIAGRCARLPPET